MDASSAPGHRPSQRVRTSARRRTRRGRRRPTPPSAFLAVARYVSPSSYIRTHWLVYLRQDSRELLHSSSSETVRCQQDKRHSSSSSSSSWMDMDMGMEVSSKDDTAIANNPSAVTYCCGACGYDLRLRSSDRNTASIVGGRGYGRAARRGVVAFDAVDHARLGHAEEFRCVDLRAGRGRLFFVRRTRLLCRKCGAGLGFGYHDRAGDAKPARYDIRIRALQPLLVAGDAQDAQDDAAA